MRARDTGHTGTKQLALAARTQTDQPPLPAVDGSACASEAALRQAATDRRALLHLPAGEARDRQACGAAHWALVLDRARLEDPRTRGRSLDRAQDRDGA